MSIREKRDVNPNDGDRGRQVIDAISLLPWEELQGGEILQVARAYYYFSIQFRENLEIALTIWADDPGLARLYDEECNTDSLSPWPGVAEIRERMNHDEFMRRLLELQAVEDAARLDAVGAAYLDRIRAMDALTRAESIISYEDGGLSQIFQAILRATCWDGPAAQAFRHFLERHIQFDKHATAGHGAMVRHIQTRCDVTPLWSAFLSILIDSVPRVFAAGSRADKDRPIFAEHRARPEQPDAGPAGLAAALA